MRRENELVSTITVQFEYATGLRRSPVTGATLVGAWDATGRPSPDAWSSQPMRRGVAADGSDAFFADVQLDAAGAGREFAWGVSLERNAGESVWGIPAEVADLGSTAQVRAFTLKPSGGEPQREAYRLSHHRSRGARPLGEAIRYAVWAPNARSVEVVFGCASGYIADDGSGADTALAQIALQRDDYGEWSATSADFAAHVGRGYMYRVTRDDGQVVYRTSTPSSCCRCSSSTAPAPGATGPRISWRSRRAPEGAAR